MIKKILYVFIAVVISIVLWWQWYARQSLPQYEGDISVEGIESGVQIMFDDKGIPQIWAEDEEDMYFALGWQHASERLFQMEMIRHVSRGRLSEIMGHGFLTFDMNIRRLGFENRATREINGISPRARLLLQSYLNGINERISQYKYFPPEFLILGFEPEEWDLTDIGTILLYQTWFSHAMINAEKWEKKMLTAFGDEIAPFMDEYMNWSPATLRKEDFRGFAGDEFFPLRMTNASNSFIVSPEKSATGKALLASDPHMPVNMLPGFWYAAALHSGDSLNFAGITTPGLPLVVMGHNRAMAWAFTVSAVDVIDYYAEPLDKKDSLLYKTPSGWSRMEEIKEYFFINGEKEPVEKIFYLTRHGVVTEFRDSVAIALHWAGNDFPLPKMIDNIFLLPGCNNFEDFRRIVTGVGALSANWTYADSAGNIGYQLGTPVPVRNFVNSIAILPGDSARYDWRGYLPLGKTPHVLNPDRGWLATCNNQIISQDGGAQKIPGFYDPYRIIRADEVLSGEQLFSPEDLRKLQMDLISSQALRWKEVLARAADRSGDKESAEKLRNWNGEMSGESRVAGLFQIWWELLPGNFLGDEVKDRGVQAGNKIKEALLTLKNASWVDDVDTKKIETWNDIMEKTFLQAKERWQGKKWSDFITLSFKHMLSKSKIFSFFFRWDAGEFSYHGSGGTLNASFYRYEADGNRFNVVVAPSMRMIVDFSALDSSTFYLPVGQSGHPYSGHYRDMVNIWLNDSTNYLPISWEGGLDKRVSQLNLLPGF